MHTSDTQSKERRYKRVQHLARIIKHTEGGENLHVLIVAVLQGCSAHRGSNSSGQRIVFSRG